MAPGKVLVTADGWSADTTKAGFLGMMAHWIEVKEQKWKMRAEVITFKALSGAHSGENLERYAMGLLNHVGIMDKKRLEACYYVFSFHFTFTPLLLHFFYHYLITLLQGHKAIHAVAL